MTLPYQIREHLNFIYGSPTGDILIPAEINALGNKTLAHGGRVSYKTNPNGRQSPYELYHRHPELFVVLRTSPDESQRVVCVHNISAQPQSLELNPATYVLDNELYDILLNEKVNLTGPLSLKPYAVKWLV